jgi:cytochrome bd-type quinol oxidase subunit 2
MRLTTLPPPQSTRFVYEEARRALQEQMRWIDALDTKAGVLLAAGGLIAGLLITANSPLSSAPEWIVMGTALLLLGALVLAVLAFATRRYETAPNLEALVSVMSENQDDFLRWMALPDVLEALEINESKVSEKAAYLFYAGASLLLGIVLFGGYYVWEILG